MKTVFRGWQLKHGWLLLVLIALLILTAEGGSHAHSAGLVIQDPSSIAQSEVSFPAPSQQSNISQASPARPYNLIANGSFEDGFVEGVAAGWQPFATAGVQAGWHDDTWRPVLYDGEHAQLLALKDAQERDRYVGIFQTVPVVRNADYILTLHGLVRSDEGSVVASDYGYRLQYGIDYAGGTDWRSPQIEWVELPWDEQPRTTPPPGGYRIETYTTTIRAQSPVLTLFIRGWKKWVGTAEGNYNVDGISLVMAGTAAPAAGVSAAQGALPASPPAMPQTGASVAENGRLALASIALVILLVFGVLWRSKQRHG